MTALEKTFSNDQMDDFRNQGQEYNVDADDDGIGENSEQTPLAGAVTQDNYSTPLNQATDFGPGDEDDDDDDLLEDDSDLIEDDEDLPLEDDDDDDDDDLIGVDIDEDVEDEDFDETDSSINEGTSFDADFRPSNHGRTTGTMTDHEPGIGGV